VSRGERIPSKGRQEVAEHEGQVIERKACRLSNDADDRVVLLSLPSEVSALAGSMELNTPPRRVYALRDLYHR
jgi:hypothetical protein